MANVGIVLISHSEQIVEGMEELIGQVIQDVTVVRAGGTENGGIGTSIDKISSALEEADQGDGVILFYDLGSAKMNAELVLEMAERDDFVITEAPLVEGAYVAAVEASVGRTLEEILASLKDGFGLE